MYVYMCVCVCAPMVVRAAEPPAINSNFTRYNFSTGSSRAKSLNFNEFTLSWSFFGEIAVSNLTKLGICIGKSMNSKVQCGDQAITIPKSYKKRNWKNLPH